MPLEVNYLDSGAGVLFVSSGLLTGKDFIETKNNLLKIGQLADKIRHLIYDLTQIESLDFPFADFKKLEDADRLLAEINPSLIIALIVKDELAVTLAKMWIARTDEIPWDKKIVSEEADAFSWVREKMREKFAAEITGE